MNLVIIPARSGSKRIPQKNIKSFLSEPMISYPIRAMQKSKVIDKIIISTNCKKTAKIAKEYGALVPFMRPEKLSDDLTPTVPVIAHAVNKLITLGYKVENVCCVYPCTPLLEFEIVDSFYELFISGKYDFVYPVVKYPHPIQRAMRMLKSKKMEFVNQEHEVTRTQDLEQTYHDAGQFYWGTVDAWLKGKKMHTDGIGIEIEPWRIVDIDENSDWEKAKLLKKMIKYEN